MIPRPLHVTVTANVYVKEHVKDFFLLPLYQKFKESPFSTNKLAALQNFVDSVVNYRFFNFSLSEFRPFYAFLLPCHICSNHSASNLGYQP